MNERTIQPLAHPLSTEEQSGLTLQLWTDNFQGWSTRRLCQNFDERIIRITCSNTQVQNMYPVMRYPTWHPSSHHPHSPTTIVLIWRHVLWSLKYVLNYLSQSSKSLCRVTGCILSRIVSLSLTKRLLHSSKWKPTVNLFNCKSGMTGTGNYYHSVSIVILKKGVLSCHALNHLNIIEHSSAGWPKYLRRITLG